MTDKARINTKNSIELHPLGPNSITWRYLGDRRYLLMLPQAFVMQVAHPVIDAGVGEHSVYKTDPWGRAERSLKLLWPILYARPEKAIRMGRELREMHRRIKGTLPDGRQYNALNPEAYGWVHGTALYTSLKLLETFEKPADEDVRQEMFREWRLFGGMLGLRNQDLPASLADYWDYFNDMIENRLQWGPVVADLMSENFFHDHPKPLGKLFDAMPNGIWQRALSPVADRMELINRATLPANFRRRFDIPYTMEDQRRFDRIRKAIKLGYRMTPRPLRYISLAREAMRDARRHPDAYRFHPVQVAETDAS